MISICRGCAMYTKMLNERTCLLGGKCLAISSCTPWVVMRHAFKDDCKTLYNCWPLGPGMLAVGFLFE